MEHVRWGIASTGKIATSMVEALDGVDGAEVIAVGSRTAESARAFADRHGIAKAHGSHDDLIADPDVDIVYIASPHSHHHDMTIAALDAGKHVLCEKAFAVDRPQAVEMIEAAERNQRFLMEAMWSWFMPAWHEIRGLIAAGRIGEVVGVDADFSLRITDPDGRHRRPDLAGGALLDLGIYPLALGRFLLGEPDDLARDVAAIGVVEGGVDTRVGGAIRHPSGAITTFTTGLDATGHLGATITGSDARIEIPAPFWYPDEYRIVPVEGRTAGVPEVVSSPNRGLAHEAEHAMQRIADGQLESDVQTWAATLDGMALLDTLRHRIGMFYPDEPVDDRD